MKNRSHALILPISAILALLVLTTSCSSGGSYDTYRQASPTAAASSAAYDYGTAEKIEYGIAEESYAYEDEMDVAADASAGSGVGFTDIMPVSAAANASRMIITTVDISAETQEFDKGTEEIQAIVESFGGFVQDSYVQGRSMYEKYGTRTASYTLRIPSERLDSFIGGIDDKFNITRKQQSGQDITEAYHDNEARLNSLKIQENRLLEMMEGATELKYLIEVQKELSDVQYQIDSYTSSKLRMQNQVSMSTVYLSLGEVVEYTPVEPDPITFTGRLSSVAIASWNNFVSFVQWCVLTFVWLLPYIILIGIIAAVIILLIKRFGVTRKKTARTDWNKLQPGTPPDTAPHGENDDNANGNVNDD